MLVNAVRYLIQILAIVSTATAAVTEASAATPAPAELIAPKPTKSGYAPIDGLRLYDEIHGSRGSTPPLPLASEATADDVAALLPGRTHYDVGIAPELATTAVTFLDVVANR